MSDKDSDAKKEADGDEEKSSGFDRRGFFTQGFRNLLNPLANVVEKRLERVGLPDWDEERRRREAAAPSHGFGATPADRKVLRPPGALEEEVFLDTCMTSGECVNACPVSAIRWAQDPDDPRRDGKPFVDPGVQACVACDDLTCMHVCPSGALSPMAREDIRMGLAVVQTVQCVRVRGEDCQICVDKCPLGSSALEIPYYQSPIEVNVDGCIGCGVCEMYCPTTPAAIVVEPLNDAYPIGGADDVPGDGGYLPID